MPYRRQNVVNKTTGEKHRSSVWLVAVPTRTGRVKRSTGTTHRPTAVRMENVLLQIGPRGTHDWAILDRIVAGSLSLAVLLEAYDANSLAGVAALRQRLAYEEEQRAREAAQREEEDRAVAAMRAAEELDVDLDSKVT